MVNAQSTIQELESKLTIRVGDEIAAQIGLLVTLYFRKANSPEIRDAVATCFEKYRFVVGGALELVSDSRTGRFERIQVTDPSPAAWLGSLAPGREWSFHFRGGNRPAVPNAFSAEALGPQDYGNDELGYFRATLPMFFFEQRSDSFKDLVLEFCRLIQPEQGYAGLGIIESPFPEIRAKYEPIVYQIAQQFPCLEVDYPVSHSIWLDQEDGIKGVNWLTILGERWLKKVGGVQALKAQLSEEYLITEYPGGALLQSGPRAQMGDLAQGLVSPHFVRLSSILKPIRIKRHRMFQHPGNDRFDEAASEAWLARFDRFDQSNAMR